MKKFAIITLAVVLVGAVSIGALAYRGGMNNTPQNQPYGYGPGGMMYNNQQMPNQQMPYGGRGGMMYNNQQMPYGGRGGMMYNNQQTPYGGRGGMRGGRGGMYGQQYNNGTAPCGGVCPYYDGTQAQPGQAPQATQMITEEKATEAANEFVAKFFPEYTVASVEKDSWRPLYFVTIKGANDAEQIMTIHGFTGQVMNIFPKIVEDAAE